jgi:hypothetical protein
MAARDTRVAPVAQPDVKLAGHHPTAEPARAVALWPPTGSIEGSEGHTGRHQEVGRSHLLQEWREGGKGGEGMGGSRGGEGRRK